ncbi:diacylglycerol kinase [Pseudomonadota bacterium]
MKREDNGLKGLMAAAGYSMKGIRACWENEAAFRADVIVSAILFLASFFVAASVEQWLLLTSPLVLIIIVELLNSAIENVVDRIGHEFHDLSGRAKDMGSAAVFFCWVIIGMAWISIAWLNLT